MTIQNIDHIYEVLNNFSKSTKHTEIWSVLRNQHMHNKGDNLTFACARSEMDFNMTFS